MTVIRNILEHPGIRLIRSRPPQKINIVPVQLAGSGLHSRSRIMDEHCQPFPSDVDLCHTPIYLIIFGAILHVLTAGTLILGWFGFSKMGITGAAVASILTSGLNTSILLIRLCFGRVSVPLRLARFQIQWPIINNILRVGVLGLVAVAGYGIVARVEFLLIPMVFGLGAVMTALIGMNTGAGNLALVEHIGWIGGGYAATLSGVIGLGLAINPGMWINLFTAITRYAAVRTRGKGYR